ncbi:sugar O-acetyltransferase [Photobacterium makurazakiensis]|uniref:sugar O-acetyltransferase n=1 Tax=Photobacterium makurazakiensis TaxID=2910234 RepID=UPI003D14A1FA
MPTKNDEASKQILSTKERMRSQKIYMCDDEDLMAEQEQCLEILYDFNHTRPSEGKKRAAILNDLLAEVGEGCYIEPPLRANWGKHTHLGNHVYANFNLTLVDDTDIYIGDHVMIAPNVTIATAGHPIDPDLRRQVAQFNIPVHIGNNVWIGAGSVILPGVHIGENTVIGAGSVVTKDIPENVVAVGNPCRVLRSINDRDKEYYYKDMKIDL